MSQSIDKGPATLILLVVAFGISGVGVALDGRVLPQPTDTSSILESAAVQPAHSQNIEERKGAEQSTEVAQQLRRAIDTASQSETERVEGLEEKAVASKTKIGELNQLLAEKGGSGPVVSSSEKAGQFNRQLAELKARLGELQQSR